MKSLEQINEARSKIIQRFATPGLSDFQKCVLLGMTNAFCWVADSPNGDIVDRLLSGESMAPGKDPTQGLKTIKRIEEILKNEMDTGKTDS